MWNAVFVLQASLAVAILAGDVARRLDVVVVDNWADMKTQCEAGHEVSLAQSFEGDFASYPGEIDFSGKVCVIRGNGKTLDAGGNVEANVLTGKSGRFFTGTGTGSSLEVHGLTLRNGVPSGKRFQSCFLAVP
jgi:hypothetical protein